MTDLKHSMAPPPDDGGPAYPLTIAREFDSATGAPIKCDVFPGMALRDWFAGQVLITLGGTILNDTSMASRAALAYRFADHMLKARKIKHDI